MKKKLEEIKVGAIVKKLRLIVAVMILIIFNMN